MGSNGDFDGHAFGTKQSIICIVDHDERSRNELTVMAEGAGFGTRHFASGDAFLTKTDAEQANCILLGLTKTESLAILKALNAQYNLVPVIVIGDEVTVRDAVSLMRAGAFDVVERPFKDGELLVAIRAAIDQHALVSSVARGLANLSKREREVMQLLLDAKTSKQIGQALGISPKTAEKHRANVLWKTGAESQSELLVKVLPLKQARRHTVPESAT